MDPGLLGLSAPLKRGGRIPVLRRETFFAGEPDEQGLPDIWWFRPDGRRMARRDWAVPGGPVGIFLNGDAIRSVTLRIAGKDFGSRGRMVKPFGSRTAASLTIPTPKPSRT